jgi:hypothetical protein
LRRLLHLGELSLFIVEPMLDLSLVLYDPPRILCLGNRCSANQPAFLGHLQATNAYKIFPGQE